MDFIKSKTKDYYLLDTGVENVFISEYLPTTPGEYVKVYLYALMCAEHGINMSSEEIGRQLGLTEKDIDKAWNYFEKLGIIKKRYLDRDGKVDFTVELMSLRELMYGKIKENQEEEAPQEINVFGNEEIKKIFDEVEKLLARNLSSTELTEIISWMEDDKIAPEVVLFGFDYALGKNKASVKYVGKVVHSWNQEGYYTKDAVQEHLEDVDNRFYSYKRVMRALGMTRMPTEAEKKMMDGWFDDLGYNMDKVLEACGKTVGITTPTFSYVNKVLENWANDAKVRDADVNSDSVSQSTLTRYYTYLRNKAQEEAEQRKKEAYQKVPRIKEIDDEISKLGAKLSKDLLMGKETGDARKTQDKMDRLSEERAVELTDNGLSMDYTDIRYKCDKCNDTGMTDLGKRCTCVNERMEEAAIWAKSMENKGNRD